jgi:hypothetical protein
MPPRQSRATRADAKNAERTTTTGTTLKGVPGQPATPPVDPAVLKKVQAARQAPRAAKPAPAPAVADPVAAVTARLAGALAPDRDLPASVVQRSAAAAQTARITVGENMNQDGTPKGTPAAKATAAAAKASVKAAVKETTVAASQRRAAAPKAPKEPGKTPDATATAVAFDRHIGVIQVMTVTGRGASRKEVPDILARCEHAAKNGHLTVEAAVKCIAGRLKDFADQPAATVGVTLHDRFTGQYQPIAEGADPQDCGCKFGHKTRESAIACARTQASRAGLLAA